MLLAAACGSTVPDGQQVVDLTAERLFLPAGVRDLAWDVSCKCFHYVGAATHRM
ncbi:MAG: hypothetical protein M3O32_00040 [Actinomycetota bacterium]|nr:hypothetical protein [Actinomycetota bacterium]